ncbi:MAG: hypothetical protein AAF988_06320, partial [Pseudomonadota bacterium]
IELEEAFIGFSLSGLRSRSLEKTISFGWHGLSGTEEQQKENNTLPTTASFVFKLEKLPLNALNRLVRQISNSEANKNNIAQIAMMNAMMSLPTQLSRAGTKISIKDTMFKNPNYRLNFDGYVQANEDSIIGANGELTIKALGLSNLISILEQSAENLPVDRQISTSSFLTHLKKFEQVATPAPEGGDVQMVYITLDNEGRALINGQDIKSAIMQ